MTINSYFLPMARVLMVAFDGAQTLDVTGPAEVFAAAARHGAPYRVELASVGVGSVRTTSGLWSGWWPR